MLFGCFRFFFCLIGLLVPGQQKRRVVFEGKAVWFQTSISPPSPSLSPSSPLFDYLSFPLFRIIETNTKTHTTTTTTTTTTSTKTRSTTTTLKEQQTRILNKKQNKTKQNKSPLSKQTQQQKQQQKHGVLFQQRQKTPSRPKFLFLCTPKQAGSRRRGGRATGRNGGRTSNGCCF